MANEILSESFLEKYKTLTPNFGFNGLGYTVYKRTYARLKADGNTEEWWETIARCINGAQKIGAKYTKEEAERLYDLIFNLKCTYPGRMLWQLGTETVDLFGANSLINCFYVSVCEPAAFECIFEWLMLGSGVGFSVKREHINELPRIKSGVSIICENTKDADLILADSRAGWVRLLHYVLKCYFETGKSFSYSTILIRGAGEPIKRFGGVASGPQILIDGITKICSVFDSRVGKKLRSIDVLDICNIIGSIVVSGNLRRSAQICLGDPDDYLFLRAKRWDLGDIPSWRALSNNTIYADDFNHISDDVWAGYLGNGEPYGLFNLPLAQTHGRIGEKIKDNVEGLNPCITGETLVYVADGRGNVPIKQLAKEGKDIPVFCLDNKQKPIVRYMRNPRITGKKVPIYKVTLEDGVYVRVTKNHKFLLTNGDYKEAAELQYGDSLKTLTKYEASIQEIFKSNSRSQDYFWLSSGKSSTIAEHRLIAEFSFDKKIPTGYVVHHKDYNGRNNEPSNLSVMTKKAHDHLHSFDKMGDKNPMRRARKEWSKEKWDEYHNNMSAAVSGELNGRFSGYSHEDIKRVILKETEATGRKLSVKEWVKIAQKKGYPMKFSKWREDHLGGLVGTLKWAATELGFSFVDADPRTLRVYHRALSEGYDAEIINGQTYVCKSCEVSGKKFKVPYGQREQGVIGLHEANLRSWKNPEARRKRVLGINKTNDERKEKIAQQQVEILSALTFNLGRQPFKLEWIDACKAKGVSFEISRGSSPFRSFADLQLAAETFNHKVISVELDGVENVYNGTVDEFHNFFVGGWESETRSGKGKWLYINNLQCGEIGLSSSESCNLSEIFLNNIKTEQELLDASQLLYKTQKAVCALPYLHEQTTKIVHKNMRVGVSVTGVCQSLDKLTWLDNCYRELKKFDKQWSKENGWPESIKLTTCKPSGTVSILAGATPGIHPAFSQFYIRRVRMSSADKLVKLCRDAGYHVEYTRNFDNSENHDTVVISFPCESSDNAVLAKDMSAVQQLELVKQMQTIWADNAVSATIYYKKEELPEIKKWLKAHYKTSIKSVSFLLHADHGFKQAPYEEIDEQTYDEMLKKLKPIFVTSQKDGTLDGLECAGGACPVR